MPRLLIAFATTLAVLGTLAASPSFVAGTPHWPDTGGDDLNRRVGFRVVVDDLPPEAVLRIATSGLYRATVNGKFLGHGPARAGHGTFRIDEWPLNDLSDAGRSVIGIEVAASVARSYYMVAQPPFIQAEIVAGNKVLATTKSFQAIDLHPAVVRKVPRYSYQRTFSEVFRPTAGWQAWRTNAEWKCAAMPLVELEPRSLAARGVPYPDFKTIPSKAIAAGRFEKLGKVPQRAYYGFHPSGFGDFPDGQLEARPDHLMTALETKSLIAAEPAGIIAPGTFHLHDFGVNLSGFIGLRVRVEQPARLLATFDELRTGPHATVDPHRLQCVNAVQYDLPAGVHDIETFEPYTLRYLQIHALDGAIASNACFSANWPTPTPTVPPSPLPTRASTPSTRPPARPSARTPPTSSWTARAASAPDGCAIRSSPDASKWTSPDRLRWSAISWKTTHNPTKFPGLVPGMLPMCYPMDPYEEDSKHYIPNWAMWFLLELEEYVARTGDLELSDRLQPRVEGLLEFFKRYENTDGLLEKLDAWVFVEWSKANDFVQDVNYPTNMLYAAALDAAARIYQNDKWAKKAATLRETINRQSFDGSFYRDHAKRLPDGTLDIRPERTEVCQYYAFFCNTTTPAERPELWKTLVNEFGPSRRETKAHPDIFPCNQLPGNMLRIEILSRYGETARIHDEALGYWQMMAETTGTLWEHDQPQASCNHGFASHAAVVLRRDILGLREIDHLAKTITFKMPDNPLSHCRGSFPTKDGDITVEWKRGEAPNIQLPGAWKMKP
jgi:alpha-L-rhamnosidase